MVFLFIVSFVAFVYFLIATLNNKVAKQKQTRNPFLLPAPKLLGLGSVVMLAGVLFFWLLVVSVGPQEVAVVKKFKYQVMKKIKYFSFLLTLMSLSIFAFGQTKEKELTQAEQFSSQAGILLEKKFFDIGKVKGVNIQVLTYKDLNSGTTKSALRFEYEYKSSYSSESKITSIDADEIEGLVKSIKNLQTNVFPSTPEVYTEVTYRSRTGFEAGVYYSVEKAKWSTYIQIEKYDRNSLVFLTTEDFTELLGLIEQAKAKM